MRIIEGYITELAPNEVFVFGANRRFVHGAGAARQALQWGAVMGKGGLMGRTYALCTKDENIETLSLSEIKKEVEKFRQVVQDNPDKIFLLTAVGTGLAGIPVADIANLFEDFYWGILDGRIENVVLPVEFVNHYCPF